MRVCNIEMLDNGFIVQTSETDTAQGMRVATTKEQVLGMIDAEMDIAIAALNAAPVAAAAPAPTAEVIPFVADQPPVTAAGHPPVAAAPAPVAAAPAIPAAVDAPPFGSPEYVEEMNRLLKDNDRKEIKRRLDAHIADNVIEEYNKNCKAKSLLQILYNADQSVAGQTALPLDAAPAAAAPAAAAPAPAAAAPAVPAPSGVDTGITLQQVGDALSGAGQRLGQERMGEVYAIITGSPSTTAAAPTKVSEIDPAFYQNVINQANTLA